ncbi:hypothetical protein QZH41_017219, partial [Actinostola sp. cb2023]
TTLHTIDTFECEDELVNVALSPFIHGDAVAITKTGHIHTWKCGKKSDIAKVPSLAPEKKWPWYQCVYADHPRCIVIVNPVEADIFDLRVNSLSSKGFFSITSKQVELHERISAVQRHPDNTHHYLMATDQSLMIMDDRFVHHPVLKWHHHLQDPVQFIEIVPNVVPDSNDTVVMVTGSYHRETHCYQYCSGERKVSRTLAMMGNSVVTPPVSTRLPWKQCFHGNTPANDKQCFHGNTPANDKQCFHGDTPANDKQCFHGDTPANDKQCFHGNTPANDEQCFHGDISTSNK